MSVNLYYNHYFNVDIAVKCGMDAAAIFSNIVHWIQYNTREKFHFYEGRYWMHETAEHMLTHMPYLSIDRIKKAIPILIEKGYIIKGHFDKNKFNRSNYYSLPDSQSQERDTSNSKKVNEGANSHLPQFDLAPSQSADSHLDHIDNIKEQYKNNNNKEDDVVVFLEKELEKYKPSKATIQRWIKLYPLQLIKDIIVYVKNQDSNGKSTNPIGLITDLLKGGIVPESKILNEKPLYQLEALEVNSIIAKSDAVLANANEKLIQKNIMRIVIDGFVEQISLVKPLEILRKEFRECREYFEKQKGNDYGRIC